MPIYMRTDGIDGAIRSSADHFEFVEETGGGAPAAALSLNFAKIEYNTAPMQGLGADGGDGDSTVASHDLADGTFNTMEF